MTMGQPLKNLGKLSSTKVLSMVDDILAAAGYFHYFTFILKKSLYSSNLLVSYFKI